MNSLNRSLEIPEQIIGLDPGEETGWVMFDAVNFQVDEFGTFRFEELHEWAFASGRFHAARLIVCERYVLYPGKAAAQSFSDFPPVEVIGAVKYLCQLYNKPLVIQGAGERNFWGSERDAKKYAAGNGRLRKLGLWLRNKHSRDALRHVLTYLQRQASPILLGRLGEL